MLKKIPTFQTPYYYVKCNLCQQSKKIAAYLTFVQQQFLAHFVIDIIGIAHFIYIYVYGSEMICNLTCDNRLLMMIPPKIRPVPLFFFLLRPKCFCFCNTLIIE